MEDKFIETLENCFLHQHILSPTRCRGNTTPHISDLVLSNDRWPYQPECAQIIKGIWSIMAEINRGKISPRRPSIINFDNTRYLYSVN